MNWRDLFYFSKGERRALTLLLALIIAATTLLILTETADVTLSDTTKTEELKRDTIAKQREIGEKKSVEKNTPPQKTRSKEKTADRLDRLTSQKRSNNRYPKREKYPKGTIIELNQADTTSLKKIPGIGSSFAKRIVNYRTLLGGYYTLDQLMEVYGMDEERYAAIALWFSIDTTLIRPLQLNLLPMDSLRKHPYINYRQAKVIMQLRKQKGSLSGWENLTLLEEFTDSDKVRLSPYLTFE